MPAVREFAFQSTRFGPAVQRRRGRLAGDVSLIAATWRSARCDDLRGFCATHKDARCPPPAQRAKPEPRFLSLVETTNTLQRMTGPSDTDTDALANPIERAFIAPYWVNYHAEHHLFMYLPCYNLPEAHRLLVEKGLIKRMEVRPGYLDVMKLATSRG